ncbi:MAG: TVP38/TMEM64 family protein [Alphaproteobacteria bacterium]|nr:TVP38/TMEM64 family protein [Alphaproteobacteria bacterium]
MKRFLPLALLLAVVVLVYASDLGYYLSFDHLRAHHRIIVGFVEANPVGAAALYLTLYVLAVAASVPGAVFMTIIGGFLFGAVIGTTLTVIAATTGATLLFLAARTAIGDLLRGKAESFLGRMEAGFRRNAFSYLLVLRLVPLFPFFIVNLVPAFLGVGLGTFIGATLLGIIPGTLVFTLAGRGLGSIIEAGGEFSAKSVLTPEMIAALCGLALLALVPVVYRRFAERTS